MNEKKSNALHKRFPARFLLLALAACLAMAFIPFAAAQGEGEGQMQYFQFAYYFNYGSSNGECYANCYGPCLASCTATAASAGTTWNNCGSVCPSSCSSHCTNYFSSIPQANDGLPIPQTPEGWNPYESAGTPQEYWPRTPPNLPYSPPAASEGQQGSYSAEPTQEQQQQENYLTPCYPGQNYCVSPGTESQLDVGEPAFPTFPPCTPENYCYRNEGVGEATPEPAPECPIAPDGHPMRWYDYLGCQDIYWKEHYCAVGTSCNGCFGRQGCIWNGAACVPCNAPSCSYFCPRAGGAAPAGGANAQQAAQAPIIVRQKEMPAPTPQLPSEVATPAPGQPTPEPIAGVSPQPTAATAIPTPPIQCGSYASCKSCVKAPKTTEGKNQCGWSEFLSSCINGDAWTAVNASGLKAGWVTDEKSCSNEPAPSYCFEYADCFSCAGAAGIKRACQWSEKESKCVPYSPLGDFKTKDNPKANDVILPALCPEHDCAQYSDCFACQENAACLWSLNDKKCTDFKGQSEGETLYLFPSNCGTKANATPSPSPTPVACPKDCECNSQARVLKCGGTTVNDTGFVYADRAAANAGAAASLEHVDEINFNQPAAGSAATFVVKGSRSGSLLFLIPVSMDVTATINAQTGAVEKIDAPWWAFFAG